MTSHGSRPENAVTDDALRSMLAARASGVTAADARAVLAAARAEIAGPATVGRAVERTIERDGLAFAARPVSIQHRRAGVPWRLAALAMAAVVAIAVLGSAVNPSRPSASASGAPASAGAGTANGASPVAAGWRESGVPVAMSADDFARALVAGDLGGRSVLVDGSLQMVFWRCPTGGSPDPCTRLGFPGHPEATLLRPSEAIDADRVSAHSGLHEPVLVSVEGRQATFVGWVIGGYPEALTMVDVASRPVPGIGEVLLFGGYLLGMTARLPACPAYDMRCPSDNPALVDELPTDGERPGAGLDVQVDGSSGLGVLPETQSGVFAVMAANQSIRAVAMDPARSVVARLETATRGRPVVREVTIAVDDLAALVSDGSLDGRYVVVTGRVRVAADVVCAAGRTCARLRLDRAPGVAIGAGTVSEADVVAAIAAHPDDAPVVLRAEAQSLALVGWLANGGDPETIDRLAYNMVRLGPGDVAIADATLLRATVGVACAYDTVRETTCPDPAPPEALNRLVAPDGDRAIRTAATPVYPVDLAPGFRPTEDRMPGPFLIAPAEEGSEHQFQVLGRFRTEDVVGADDVVAPTTEPVVTVGGGGQVTVGQLRDALADGSMDGRLVLVTGTAREVGPCGFGTQCTVFRIDEAPALQPQWTGSLLRAIPETGTTAQPAVVSGTLVLQPRNGVLRFVGRLVNDARSPWSVGQAFGGRLTPARGDPYVVRAVTAVLTREGYALYRLSAPPVGGSASPVPGGAAVAVADDAGIDEVAGPLTGWFLVREASWRQCVTAVGGSTLDQASQCTPVDGTVVAQYDGGTVMRLVTRR